MVTKEKISTAYWMFDHFQRVANQTKGDICIGGVITMLAHLLGHDLDSYQLTVIEGKSAIDMELMYFMGMVRKDGQGHYILEAGAAPCGHDRENVAETHAPESDDDVAAQPALPMPTIPSMPTVTPPRVDCSHTSQFEELRNLITTGFTRLQVDQGRIYRKLNRRCDAIQQQITELASKQRGAVHEDMTNEEEDEEDEADEEEDEEDEAEDEEDDD